ncbi:hypothetical protein Tco_0463451, partial [Tanacetum coccineum]
MNSHTIEQELDEPAPHVIKSAAKHKLPKVAPLDVLRVPPQANSQLPHDRFLKKVSGSTHE